MRSTTMTTRSPTKRVDLRRTQDKFFVTLEHVPGKVLKLPDALRWLVGLCVATLTQIIMEKVDES
jgi:hypothetical protein